MNEDVYRSVGAIVGLACGLLLMISFGLGGMILGALFGAGGAVVGGICGEKVYGSRQ